jgi:hypothetical protein
MEGSPKKKNFENTRLEKEAKIELPPTELTLQQEADLRAALLSIDSPYAQKKSQ